MVEVKFVEDPDDDIDPDDGIDSLIAELFPPPKHTVVEIRHLAFCLEPASNAKPTSNVKPASTRFPSNAKKKTLPFDWRKPIGQGRDKRRHKKRLITRDGHECIEHP
jgi:hypothetical protein